MKSPPELVIHAVVPEIVIYFRRIAPPSRDRIILARADAKEGGKSAGCATRKSGGPTTPRNAAPFAAIKQSLRARLGTVNARGASAICLLIGHRFLLQQNIYRRTYPLPPSSLETSLLGNFAGRRSEDEVWTERTNLVKEFLEDEGIFVSSRGWTKVDEIRGKEDRFCSERRNFRGWRIFLRDEFLQEEEGIIQAR